MRRRAEPVLTNELCCYGCGQIAKYKNISGNLTCSEYSTQCPENKRKNSSGVLKAHKDGKIPGWNKLRVEYELNTAWSKGLDAFSDDRVKSKYDPEKVFTYDGKGPHKKILIKERGHKCEKCGNTHWNELLITLELEHIDGDSKNNIKENLLLLCPNCHSQTPTWRRKKNVAIQYRKHDDNTIKDAIQSSYSMQECLEKLNMRWGSCATIAKVMIEQQVVFKPL